MNLDDLMGADNAARIAHALPVIGYYWDQAVNWFTVMWPTILFVALFCGCVLLLNNKSIVTEWSPMGRVRQWWGSLGSERRRMKAEREKQADFLTEKICGLIEDEITAGRWKRQDANHWYVSFYKFLPGMKGCFQAPPNLLERLAEYKINKVKAPVVALTKGVKRTTVKSRG